MDLALESYTAYFRAGGWLMGPLCVVAFLIWHQYFAILARLLAAVRTPDICDLDVQGFLHSPQTAAEALKDRGGVVPRIVQNCLARMNAGVEFNDAFAQCRHAETVYYTYAFYVMGALVTTAPLLGLLGTVLGMIETFDGVAMRSGDTGRVIAGGVSQALITTQVGLVAALPGTFGLAHLYRLYQRLKNTVDECGSHLALQWKFAVCPAADASSIACPQAKRSSKQHPPDVTISNPSR